MAVYTKVKKRFEHPLSLNMLNLKGKIPRCALTVIGDVQKPLSGIEMWKLWNAFGITEDCSEKNFKRCMFQFGFQ